MSNTALHAHLLCQIFRRELAIHQLALLDADAVLAGEAAADFDAEAQNVFACLLGFALLFRIVDVVEDQRMHVAVAGVEDVGNA